MRASTVGRNVAVAVVGMSLALGALEARAQIAVPGCEGLLVLGKASFVLGVARDLGPDGGVTRLVLGAGDEGFLCVSGAQSVAAGTSRVAFGSGENVYIRGFGLSPSFTNSPPSPPPPQPTSRRYYCPKCPKLTRAE